MGEVYRARDTRLKRDVAIKVLPDAFAQRSRAARALSARSASARHAESSEHRADLRPRGVDRQRSCWSSSRGRRSPIASRRARSRSTKRCRSPGRSPRRSKPRTSSGIIHRDLKPANIKVRARRHGEGPRLRAREGDRSRRASRGAGVSQLADDHVAGHDDGVGVILGTAAYMSPEQARGQAGRQAHRHLGVRLCALTRC